MPSEFDAIVIETCQSVFSGSLTIRLYRVGSPLKGAYARNLPLAVTHRIWDFRGDQVGIVWFQKTADGSFVVQQRHLGTGFALTAYASHVRSVGFDAEGVDYVRYDAFHVRNLNGETVAEAMRRMGLNPEVLPAPMWRSARPFAEAA